MRGSRRQSMTGSLSDSLAIAPERGKIPQFEVNTKFHQITCIDTLSISPWILQGSTTTQVPGQ